MSTAGTTQCALLVLQSRIGALIKQNEMDQQARPGRARVASEEFHDDVRGTGEKRKIDGHAHRQS